MSSHIPYVSDYHYVTPPPRTKDEKQLWRLLIMLYKICRTLKREREEKELETRNTIVYSESNDVDSLQPPRVSDVKMSGSEYCTNKLRFRSEQEEPELLSQITKNKIENCHVNDDVTSSINKCGTSTILCNAKEQCRVKNVDCMNSESKSECVDQTSTNRHNMVNTMCNSKKETEDIWNKPHSPLVHSVEELVEDTFENEEQTCYDEKYIRDNLYENINYSNNCLTSLQRFLFYLHDEQVEVGASALDVAIQLPEVTLRRMIVQWILQHPWLNFDGCAPLIVAITINDSAIVERLLQDMRVDINSGFPLIAAIRINRMMILQLLLVNSRIHVNHGNAFYYAVIHHNTRAIELLSNHTALDPNRSCQGYCDTPLVFAMRQFIQCREEEVNLNRTWEQPKTQSMRKLSLSSTSSLPSLSSSLLSSSAAIVGGSVVYEKMKSKWQSAPRSVEEFHRQQKMLLEQSDERDYSVKKCRIIKNTQVDHEKMKLYNNNNNIDDENDNTVNYNSNDAIIQKRKYNDNNKNSDANINNKCSGTPERTLSQLNGQSFSTFPFKSFTSMEHNNAKSNRIDSNNSQLFGCNSHLQTHSCSKNTLHTSAETWLEVFRLLLSIPAIDVNTGFIFTPLQLAVMHGIHELVHELLYHPLLQPNKVPSSSRTLACAFSNLLHESCHSWSHSTSHRVHGHLPRYIYNYGKSFSTQTLHRVTCTPLMLAAQQRRLDLFELLLSDRRVLTPMILLNELERDVHDSFALTFIEVWGTYVPQWEGWAWRWRRRLLCTACLAMSLLTSIQFIFGMAHIIHSFICSTSAESVTNTDITLSSCSTGTSLLGNAFYVMFGTDFIASVIAVVSILSQSQDKSFYSHLEKYNNNNHNNSNNNNSYNELNNSYSNNDKVNNERHNNRFHSRRNVTDQQYRPRCKCGNTHKMRSNCQELELELQEQQQHYVQGSIHNEREMQKVSCGGNSKPRSVSVHQATPWHSSAVTLMELTPLSSQRLQSLLKSYDIHDKTSLYNMRSALRRAYWRYYKHFFKTQTDIDHVDELLFHYNESCQLRSTVIMFLLKWLFVFLSPFVPIVELWCTARMLSLYFARQAHPQPHMNEHTHEEPTTQSATCNVHSKNYTRENVISWKETIYNGGNNTPNCVINVEPHVHNSKSIISNCSADICTTSSHKNNYANCSGNSSNSRNTHQNNNVHNSEFISYSCPSLPLTNIKIKKEEELFDSAHDHSNEYNKHYGLHDVASVNQTLINSKYYSECERERLALHSRGIKKRVSFNLKPAHTVMYDKVNAFNMTATAPTIPIAPSTPVQKNNISLNEISVLQNNFTNSISKQSSKIIKDECVLQENLLNYLPETHVVQQQQQHQRERRQVQSMTNNVGVNNPNNGKVSVTAAVAKSFLPLPQEMQCNSYLTREHQIRPKTFARQVLYHVPNLYLRRAIYLSYETIVPSRLLICIVAIFVHLILLFPSNTNYVYEPPNKSVFVTLSTICLICSIIAGGALLLSLLMLRHTNKFNILAGKENHIYSCSKNRSKNTNYKKDQVADRIISDTNMWNWSENIADNVNVAKNSVDEDWQSCDEIDYQSNFYMTKDDGDEYNQNVTG